MRMREMTEAERRTLRVGLRMVARLIARRHLALRTAEATAVEVETSEARPAADGAAPGGTER